MMILNKNKKSILWALGILITAIYGYNICVLIPRLIPSEKIPGNILQTASKTEPGKFAVKKIPYKKMNGRNIFLPPNFKRRKRTKPAPAPKPVNIYELNGIIPDSHNPTAILMNTKTKSTIIAGSGQMLDDGKTRLVEIKNNFVIIERENEKEELRIKR
ncbi:MAG: hypothetical protein U9O97_04960 [Elusimicrobiota bacterium]|nr:hypothetical protein [Elusimicrobiota bacterium]